MLTVTAEVGGNAADAGASKGKAAAREHKFGHPEHYLCPITLELMLDPVVDANGHTFERRAITMALLHQEQFRQVVEAARMVASQLAIEDRLRLLQPLDGLRQLPRIAVNTGEIGDLQGQDAWVSIELPGLIEGMIQMSAGSRQVTLAESEHPEIVQAQDQIRMRGF